MSLVMKTCVGTAGTAGVNVGCGTRLRNKAKKEERSVGAGVKFMDRESRAVVKNGE